MALTCLLAMCLCACGSDYSDSGVAVGNNEGNNVVNNDPAPDVGVNNEPDNNTPAPDAGDNNSPPDVVEPVERELIVAPVTQEAIVGETVSYRALLIEGDDDRDVTFEAQWSISPGLGEFIAPGRVRTAVAGDAVIEARFEDLSTSANLIVTDVQETLDRLFIEPGVVEVPASFQTRVRAIGIFTNGITRDLSDEVEWSLEGDNFELVFEGGVQVRGLNEGQGELRAAFGAAEDFVPVVVTPVPLEAIELIPPTATVPVNGEFQLTALGRFANGTLLNITDTLTWDSDDPGVARVDGGLLTGVDRGETLVNARLGDIVGQAQVRVTGEQVAQLSISPSTIELAAGAQGFLRASAVLSGSEAADVTNEANWRSDDEDIVTVDVLGENARLQGLRPGTTRVRATYGMREATALVTVTQARLVSVAFAPPAQSIPAGAQGFFSLVGTYSDDSRAFLNQNALWRTDDAEVVLVDNGRSAGLLTGRTPGRATITATIEGLTASGEVTVTDAEVVGLQITPPTASTPQGDNLSLNAFAIYSDNALRGVTQQATWVSQDPEVAQVSNAPGERGLVTGISAGDTVVSATFDDFSDTASINVSEAVVESLFITPGGAALPVGRQRGFGLLAVYDNGATLQVAQEGVWTTSDATVAEVSNADGQRGTVSAVGPGQATITARFGRQQATAQIFVIDAELTELFVFPPMAETSPGLSVQLFAVGVFSDNRVNDNLTGEVVWSSSDETVATVTNIPRFPGRVVGVRSGTAVITATSGDITASATIRVVDRTITGLTLSPPDPLLPVDAFQLMTAIADFNDGTTADVTNNCTWTSSDAAVVATLPNPPGLINTLVPGEATITAEIAGQEASTSVTVRPATPTNIVISPVNPIISRMGQGQGQQQPATVQFYVTGLYDDQSSSDLTQLCEWTSSDPQTLLVFDELGAKGFAVALRAGAVSVNARCGEFQTSTNVTVR